MKEKGYRKQEKGITLIALIITIIVMLILVAVTIQVTINGGIFEKAGEAVGKTKNSMEEENDMMKNLAQKMDNINSKPNAPEMMEGMIPVTWDAEKKVWVKADKESDDWYEYGTTAATKRWANSVTVKNDKTADVEGSKSRDEYQKAAEGTEIAQEDILGMYVWIPRYAYKIPNENYHTSNAGIIDIKFLSGTSGTKDMIDGVEYNETTTSNFTKFPDGYVVHPAFSVENGEEEKIELTGIWVAKFEASSDKTTDSDKNIGAKYGASKQYNGDTEPSNSADSDQVTIRPNVTSWRNINVKNCYIACTNMVKPSNIHGLTSETDSHLMKDTEWGAVAYLTQSRYGNPQGSDDSSGVWINSYWDGATDDTTIYYTPRTGMVGGSRDEWIYWGWKATSEPTEAEGKVMVNFGSNGIKTFYTYETENGLKGSTTGTIYGIYDMSGGSWECQASYLKDVETADSNLNNIVKYFNNSVPAYHKTAYAGTLADEGENYDLTENKARYGNTVWETSKDAYRGGGDPYDIQSWSTDYCYFVKDLAPFAVRGGRYSDNKKAGLFAFHCDGSCAREFTSFRPVLWNEQN